MKVNGKAEVVGEVSGQFQQYDDLPTDPKVGMWARVNQAVMVCVDVEGAPTWVPITPKQDTKIVPQSVASDTWDIPHGLGSEEVFVQCFDDDKKVIIPSEIIMIDEDNIQIKLPQVMTGSAIIMYGYENGSDVRGAVANGSISGGLAGETIVTDSNQRTGEVKLPRPISEYQQLIIGIEASGNSDDQARNPAVFTKEWLVVGKTLLVTSSTPQTKVSMGLTITDEYTLSITHQSNVELRFIRGYREITFATQDTTGLETVPILRMGNHTPTEITLPYDISEFQSLEFGQAYQNGDSVRTPSIFTKEALKIGQKLVVTSSNSIVVEVEVEIVDARTLRLAYKESSLKYVTAYKGKTKALEVGAEIGHVERLDSSITEIDFNNYPEGVYIVNAQSNSSHSSFGARTVTVACTIDTRKTPDFERIVLAGSNFAYDPKVTWNLATKKLYAIKGHAHLTEHTLSDVDITRIA